MQLEETKLTLKKIAEKKKQLHRLADAKNEQEVWKDSPNLLA